MVYFGTWKNSLIEFSQVSSVKKELTILNSKHMHNVSLALAINSAVYLYCQILFAIEKKLNVSNSN